jgi:hypothetical protein
MSDCFEGAYVFSAEDLSLIGRLPHAKNVIGRYTMAMLGSGQRFIADCTFRVLPSYFIALYRAIVAG